MSDRFSRRDFLIGSVSLAGGVAFGTHAVAQGNPPNTAIFNPWVKITPEKITLITPHADVGQGVASMQAILIAEEMDLELGQFEIEFGPPSAAYYNTALVDELVPRRATDKTFLTKKLREGERAAAPEILRLLGLDLTGGSSSAADSYDKLRMAGAVARETLKAAAAKRIGVAVKTLSTQGGSVILSDGRRIAYTDLAADASGIRPVQNVKLRDDPKQWRLIGKTTQRLDIAAKVTGAQKFGIDQVIDGMVYAAVKLNPHKGEALKSVIDDSKARSMPGVKDVLKITNGIAVIASNSWYAMKAAEAVMCDWAPAAYPAEQDQHWAKLKDSFAQKEDEVWRRDGNVDAALKGPTVIDAEYRAPYVAHQPLEPLNAIAVVRDGGVEVWAGHQTPRLVQWIVAAMTGRAHDQVVFHNQWSGGSFGHRLEFENIRCAVEIAKQMPGTPVKVVFSREQDFLQDFPRQIGMARNRGAVRDGKIVAADFHVATVSATRSQIRRTLIPFIPQPISNALRKFKVELPLISDKVADVQIAAGIWNLPYRIPNFRTTAYAVPGLSPCSSWRAVGASTAGFFGECFIDELIHATGRDQLEVRMEMCAANEPGHKVLEEVGRISGWTSSLGNGKGRGVAFVESFGTPVAEVIEVSWLNQADKSAKKMIHIDKVWVVAEVGPVLDRDNLVNLVQGGVIWGLGHAMNCELTYKGGVVEQQNYNRHEGMRLYQCPAIEVLPLTIREKPGGIGEPPVPPAAPALANAIFAATGERLREMPFKSIEFV